MIETSAYASSIKKIEGINSKLEEHEKDNLFRKYLNFFNIQWEFFSGRVYEKLVSNFLLFRIFCEVYQRQSIGSILDVYMLDLFQKYYRQVRDGMRINANGNTSIEKVFCEVVRHMVDNQIYKDVSIQTIVDNAKINKNILIKLVDENIFFRRDIADKVGVLLDSEVINFTFDEFRDYLIADYLSNVLLTENKLKAEKFILDEIIPEKTLFEGVSKYLFFISKKDPKNKSLSSILESASWYPQKYIQYLFQTNDDDLTIEDIEKVKTEFISGGDKSELIFRMLIYYRFDICVYKKLNISLLFSLLIEMSENERINKFEKHFQAENIRANYGSSEDWINLDHYFEFVADSIKKGDNKNQAYEFLFFIVACDTNHIVHSKAKQVLNLLFEKYPNEALELIKKYQNCSNQHFKDKANSIETIIRIKKR